MNKIQSPGKTGSHIVPIKENVKVLTNVAYTFTWIAFWSCTGYHPRQVSKAKSYIRRILLQSYDPYKAFIEFCQRIMLFREHMIENEEVSPGVYISTWLNEEDGYLGTESLFQELEKERIKTPLYKIELKGLAEAIFDMAEDPTEDNFNFWLNWLRLKLACNEICLFTMFVSYYHFKAR